MAQFPDFSDKVGAWERLDQGRTVLRELLPLLWPMTLRFRYVLGSDVPTTAIDIQGNLYANEEFLMGKPPAGGDPADPMVAHFRVRNALDTAFLLAHEALHLVKRDLERHPDGLDAYRDPNKAQLYNVAGDATIAQLLRQTLLCHSPLLEAQMRLLDKHTKGKLSQLMHQHDWNDPIYYGLLESQDEWGGSGGTTKVTCTLHGEHTKGQGQPGDAEGQGSGTGPGQGVGDIPDWDLLAREGVALQKSRGTNPGGPLGKLLEALDDSRIPWPLVVGPHLTELVEVDRYTWSKPSRRPNPDPLIVLPGTEKRRGCVVNGIDTSGSMSPDELRISTTELLGMCRQLDVDLYVMLHNVAPYHGRLVRSPADLADLPYSAGGTSHRPLFKVIEDALAGQELPNPENLEGQDPQFDPMPSDIQAVVCFTDMCSDFPEQSTVPTVWVNTTGGTSGCPFGVEVPYVK